VNFVNSVNDISKLPLTGLVNNSNLLHETTTAHVIESMEIISDAANRCNLPIKYTQLKSNIYIEVSDYIKSEKILLIDKLQMREGWQ
jgi:hypothetical protein